MVEPYIVLLIGFGALVLLTAWLPMVLKEAPLSLPILCVIIGAAIFASPFDISVPNLATNLPVAERFTELVVIISLMGAALKIDRKIGWRSWMMTWRLLGLAMPVTIFVLAVLGQAMLGLGIATALLLAASLAPTDPVLASDIQVGPPKTGKEDEARFALTSEAGLNDGLAFPFIMCAIALAQAGQTGEPWLLRWFGVEVIWRLSVGVGVGVCLGYLLGWLVFRLPNRAKLSRTGDGFVALGITVSVYGVTEALHGYGFVSVFVAGLALRASERNHDYHQTLHDFAEQLERILMMVALVIFGGLLWSGGIFDALTWTAAGYALLAIFVVRPIAGWISLWRTNCPTTERAVISFFGIRGLGTIYYLAYALPKGPFEETELVWSAACLTVLISIFLHGATVTPVMRMIDRRNKTGVASAEARKLTSPQ
ncbi:cation:proton antiporter [Bradyrhizobium roseum]|uniref:cation:proton antiporter n=1 Tax=Bradyrhizobium roseum TaxID=3056648 RepID=UPI002637734F|nr:cation:proton antiporter [Bradyrhizobium roseus]WKA27318.1 cation:proton antiporter [Bradyrhizobium roseus]